MHKSLTVIWLVVCTYFICGQILAFGNTLTLDEAFDLARRQNPAFNAEKANLDVAKARVTQASSRLNPSIMSDNGTAEKTYRLGITQTIELGGKRQKRTTVLQGEQEAVIHQVQTQWLDLRARVRETYTDLYIAQERIKVLEETYKTTQNGLKETFDAQLTILKLENELERAEFEFKKAKNTLNTLLNQPLDILLHVEKPPSIALEDQYDLNRLVQKALAKRPELRENESQQQVLNHQTQLSQAKRIPDLQLTIGPDWVTPGPHVQYGIFIMGSMDLRLFDDQKGILEELQAQKKQTVLKSQALQNDIILEVANTYDSFLSLQKQLNRFEEQILPQASVFQEKHQASTNTPDALNALITHKSIQMEYFDLLREYQNTITDIERAVGVGL